MLSPDLLELLRCPRCRGVLREEGTPEGLTCAPCALFFPIVEGIPNMLLEEARSVAESARNEK